MRLYSIYDRKASIFDAPFSSLTDGTASRVIKELVKKGGRLVSYIEDFDLFCLGEYEPSTGVITPEEPSPRFVAAVSVIAPAASQAAQSSVDMIA